MRIALSLLLLALSVAPAWAREGREAESSASTIASTCVASADVHEESSHQECRADDEDTSAGSTSTSSGNGTQRALRQRSQGRWHSFLPGMLR